VGGYVPEEDGVDHRVEPKMWLTDGSDEGASGGSKSAQATSRDPLGDANPSADPPPLPADSALPANSRAPRAPAGRDIPARGQDIPPPYPGQQASYQPPAPYQPPAGSAGPAGQEAAYGAPPVPEVPIPARGQDIPPPYRGQQGQQAPYQPPASYQPPAGSAGPAGQEAAYGAPPVPEAAYGPAGQQPRPAGDGPRIPPYQPQGPPYPAQVAPAPSPGLAPSVAAKVAAPFAALTKPKVKKPARPRPAAPGSVPPGPAALKQRIAAAAKTGSVPVAAAAKTASVPRGAAPTVPRGVASTRRAQLVLARIEPWSVMKFSFMISLVGWVVLFVAVTALYYVLNKLGVFHSIQSTISDVTSSKGSAGSDANGQWFSASRILGYTMLIGAVNVVLITALATVGAVIYNLVTHLAGGIEVTLKETD
jgi:hypothetical protein